MKKKLPEHKVSSGNIFADAGLPAAEDHLLKAKLVSRIGDLMEQRGLSQTHGARATGPVQHSARTFQRVFDRATDALPLQP
jgi:predicted XRE-type DNA-binding protein